jgi:NAD(P)-dependent dehydrogenase (short-subunit alcohol dehydrogenase family)
LSQHKKIALITGANKGIGLEIARQLGEQQMIVLIGARNYARGEEAAKILVAEGIEAYSLHLDVTDQQSITKAVDWLTKNYNRLDILVNNAGIAATTDVKSLLKRLTSEITLADLRTLYETNVFGLFAVTQALLPLLRRSNAGHIVNVSSGLASLGSISGLAPEFFQSFNFGYASTKSAINSLTIFLANELAQTGIKVNAVDPGPTATDMNRQASRTPAQAARVAVRFATIGADGPTGGFFDENGPLPW